MGVKHLDRERNIVVDPRIDERHLLKLFEKYEEDEAHLHKKEEALEREVRRRYFVSLNFVPCDCTHALARKAGSWFRKLVV